MRSIQRLRLTGGCLPCPYWRSLRCRFGAPTVRVTKSADQEREERSSPSWPSYRFDRIDAKNATIVFSAGPSEANLRSPGRQGQLMTETSTYPGSPDRREERKPS